MENDGIISELESTIEKLEQLATGRLSLPTVTEAITSLKKVIRALEDDRSTNG